MKSRMGPDNEAMLGTHKQCKKNFEGKPKKEELGAWKNPKWT